MELLAPETLSSLPVVVRVAETESFSAAARQLGMTPSGVSKAISRLEERFGVRLFDRTTRRVAATEDGLRFYERCRGILSDLEEAQTELREATLQPRGSILASVPRAVGEEMIVPALPRLLARYPDLDVRLELADRRVDIIGERIDVALRMGAPTSSSHGRLVRREVGAAGVVVCAAPSYLAHRGRPRRPEDLAKHLRNRLDAALDAMADALAHLTHPDGLPSQFNDGGLTMAYPASEVLLVHENKGGRPPLSKTVFALGQAGFFGARDGGDLVLIDCGAIAPDALPAHGHGDALSFEWSLGGQRFLVDPGSSEYEASARRAWERSTRAHNTLTVDDADQGEFWSRFRLGRRARVVLDDYRASESSFNLQGSHDGFALQAGAPRHERRFQVTPSTIEVEDEVLGGDGQPVRARLLLHPQVSVTLDDQGCRLERGSSAARLECAHSLRVEEAWWSPDLGRRMPTRQLVIEYGRAPCRGFFRLAAIRSGSLARIERKIVPELGAGGSADIQV